MTCLICGHVGGTEDVEICAVCLNRLLTNFALKCMGCGSYAWYPLVYKTQTISKLHSHNIEFDEITSDFDHCVLLVSQCPQCRSGNC